jgi:enolase
MTSDCAIVQVQGRRIWDSRGRPTVEVDIALDDGSHGRGIAPAGASTGSGEARELRDGGDRLAGFDVQRAVELLNTEVRSLLVGQPIADQAALDARLVAADGTPDRSRLGGNTLIASSLGLLNARAASRRTPLWRLLRAGECTAIPVPEIQIFGGGAHAQGRCDIQDFMVVPYGAPSYADALAWVAEIYLCAGRRLQRRGQLQGVADEGGYWPAFTRNEEGVEELTRVIEDAGFVPGAQVSIALDAAATQWQHAGRYRWQLEQRDFSTAQLLDEYGRWLDRYPIVSIEDPLAENDHDGMREFTRRFGHRIQVVGDDYLVTSAVRIERAARAGACNTVLIKPNQAGTVTETVAAIAAARAAGYRFIVSARSGETEDTTMVHLAMGWGADGFKVGSFTRSERMAKWNEMLRIEESLGDRARYRGVEPFPRSRPDATAGR